MAKIKVYNNDTNRMEIEHCLLESLEAQVKVLHYGQQSMQ